MVVCLFWIGKKDYAFTQEVREGRSQHRETTKGYLRKRSFGGGRKQYVTEQIESLILIKMRLPIPLKKSYSLGIVT